MASGAKAPSLEIIDPLKLSTEARARLCGELASVAERAFVPSSHLSLEEMRAGETKYRAWSTDPEIFNRYQQTTIARVEGQPVAFYHAFVQTLDVEGRRVGVIRGSSATVPGFRAGGLIARAALRTAAHYLPRHLLSRTPHYCAGTTSTPITYEMIGRRALRLFPHPSRSVDPEMRRVFRAVHGDDDWIQPEVVATFESTQTHAQLAATRSPYGRFFLEVNPRYAEGTSMRFLVRVNGPDLLYAIAASAGLAAVRPLRRRRRR